ncbi:hypothetical protein KI688_005830 [Linnemannia hyalina]|uniref:FAD-binding domain-containing protein n=1 Tax=Linnemannia hyalina TaxID=64524 RepID=A0A9P7Y3V2_9FUNG|nr:hypothetical protein KI688_005830 [Linnemannia hyalina]
MSANDKPTILIVGAGLGGLMLGALLEKSGVPYTIFERAATVKPFGAGMAVGPTLFPVFEQLGIYEEFLTIGKYLSFAKGYKVTKTSLTFQNENDYSQITEFGGYGIYIVSRPILYDLILRQVPAHKIHFGKRVLNISEENNKVTVFTSDNGIHEGDIIVGADGAYSAVRQRLYEKLRTEGNLPKADQEDLPFSCTCLVGQTKVLDPEVYPIVKEPHCQFLITNGDEQPFTAAMEQRFRDNDNAEWGAYPAQVMCDETKDFPVPVGDGKMTLGDIYDLTPKEIISKVMLEEKVFDTWHSGRVVLLGDACHKLNPAGGHGAVTAMHDAIALANLLYAMPTKTSADITRIFEDYHTERYPAVMESFHHSQQFSRIAERGFLAKMARFKPQVGFLPATEMKGSVVPVVSPSEQRARDVFEKRQQPQQEQLENAATV